MTNLKPVSRKTFLHRNRSMMIKQFPYSLLLRKWFRVVLRTIHNSLILQFVQGLTRDNRAIPHLSPPKSFPAKTVHINIKLEEHKSGLMLLERKLQHMGQKGGSKGLTLTVVGYFGDTELLNRVQIW